MNIGRVYNPPILIARCILPLKAGIGAHDEYWEDAHRSNIHRQGYTPLDRGYRITQ